VAVEGSKVGGSDSTGGKAIRLGASMGTGARWVALGASPLLVITTESNFQIWDGAGDHLLYFAESSDGVAAAASRSGLQSPVSTGPRSGGTAAAALAPTPVSATPCRGIGASHVARTVLVGCGPDVIVAQAEADLKSFSLKPRVLAHEGAEVTDLAVDESGVKMVTGASNGHVGVWDARTTTLIGTIRPTGDEP